MTSADPTQSLPRELVESATALLLAPPGEQKAGLDALCREHPAHAANLRALLAARQREAAADRGLGPGDALGNCVATRA